MSTRRKKAAGLMAGVVLLGIGGITPANAGVTEGQFESHISWWTAPTESRRWYDSNSSSDYTGIYFQGCQSDDFRGYDYASLRLWKDVPSAPDRSKGTRNNYCGWVDYGDPDDAGNYYFQLADVGQGDFIKIDYVKVGW
ncbi:hypothetical protein [Streptomyces sp. C]|uniref:hypothetical protein n=1 Tax=Streptomyces sp. C TaxID=253839 RepID=UPI000FFB7079|nr:hypothetical protein [Streptomyces sp. C]